MLLGTRWSPSSKDAALDQNTLGDMLHAWPDGVSVVDLTQAHQPLTYVNQAFEQLTGYCAGEVLGRNCRLLQGPDTDPLARRRLALGIAQMRPVTVEILNYRKDGSPFWNMVTVAPLCDRYGQVVRLIGVQRDVTERHQRDKVLAAAQQMYSLGLLASGVAHDFNNLLTAIHGCAELLQEGLADRPDLHRLARTIQDACQRGGKQVNRLLDFSSGKTAVTEPVCLQAVFDGISILLRGALHKDVRLHCRVASGTPAIQVNRAGLEMALLNLVVNAQDAMPAGGDVQVLASLADGPPFAAAAGAVHLRIIDDGEGMSAALKARIFEPHFTTKADGRGNGLGLAMVLGFVTESGGQVMVDSELGQGTCFHLLLPTAPASALGAEPEARCKSLSALPDMLPPLRILLVEDDPVVRLTCESMLQGMGHLVAVCEDAEHAQTMLRSGQMFDLLMTDVMLPGPLDGRELACWAHARQPDLRLVLTSGWGDSAFGDLGGDLVPSHAQFIQKPYTSEQLAQCLAQAYLCPSLAADDGATGMPGIAGLTGIAGSYQVRGWTQP